MPPNNILPLQEQIAHLASQHHSSEYNRSKFGLHGSPLRYVPLSLHLPEHFTQLRSRQLSDAQARCWWPARPPQTAAPVSLQDEIMAAMSEPIHSTPIRSPPSQSSKPHVKTSLTHPINISFVIPPDLVDVISSHALLATSSTSPTILEISSSFTLDRLSTLRDTRLRAFQSVQAPSLFPVIETPAIPAHFRTRSNVSDALQVAINTGIDYIGAHKKNGASGEQVTNHFLAGFIPQKNISMALSMTIPASVDLHPSHTSESPSGLADSFEIVPQLKLNSAFQALPPLPTAPSSMYALPPTWATPNVIFPYQPRRHNSVLSIGNLFLSSCPGKKVRLDGPVKGRSGVCRDLETDMKRMKELGVGCIVCCLDDDELEFLGAPWPEYERYAQTVGIDILRVPIPEGLPPISASAIDTHLVDLIKRYTLKGVPILVHCRGGVGRAGVIACCWMIRLGLCGWLNQKGDTETPSPTSASAPTPTDGNEDATRGSAETVAFVERVIALIRRRRSTKAIETYEQVKFLLEYVEYLQHNLELPQDKIAEL